MSQPENTTDLSPASTPVQATSAMVSATPSQTAVINTTPSMEPEENLTVQTTLAVQTTTSLPATTETIKKLSTPTTAMIHVNDPILHVEPVSLDSAGTITKGNIELTGTIESSYGSPLYVGMQVDFVSAYGNVTKATASDIVKTYSYGTSEYTFRINDYVFNDRPDYAVTHDSYYVSVVNVSVA